MSRRRGARYPALRAEVEEDVAPRVAGGAVVEEPQAAVHAEVWLHVARCHDGPLAAGADIRRHLLQRFVRGESLPALRLGLLLHLGAPREIAPHGLNDVMAGGNGQNDADAIANVAAVAGQIRDEL